MKRFVLFCCHTHLHTISGEHTDVLAFYILQALLRLSTFILNAVILRYISLEVLGVVNMRYILVTTTAVTVTYIG